MSLAAPVSPKPTDPHHRARHFTFGACRVDRAQRLLVAHGERRQLEPKAFDLLMYLIDHRQRVVTREELLREIWKTEFLSESVIARAVMKVRRALQDNDDTPIIETLYRVGYRFAIHAVADTPENVGEAPSVAAGVPDIAAASPVASVLAGDSFVAEALARYSAAVAEQRYATALKYIDVCISEQNTGLRREAEDVARMAAVFDAATPFRAAAVLSAATETSDLLAQAKVLCVWASYHQFAGHHLRARHLADQALRCAGQVPEARKLDACRQAATAANNPAPGGLPDRVYERSNRYRPLDLAA